MTLGNHRAAHADLLGGTLSSTPDEQGVRRSLAALTGPDAVGALAEAHEAAAVAAGIEVRAGHLDAALAGTHTGSTGLGAALDAEYAEQAARER